MIIVVAETGRFGWSARWSRGRLAPCGFGFGFCSSGMVGAMQVSVLFQRLSCSIEVKNF